MFKSLAALSNQSLQEAVFSRMDSLVLILVVVSVTLALLYMHGFRLAFILSSLTQRSVVLQFTYLTSTLGLSMTFFAGVVGFNSCSISGPF